MTDASSCGTYVLLQQGFLVFSHREEFRWCRSFVRLAAWPFAARFRACLVARLGSALVQPSCVRRNATVTGAVAVDLFTNLDQHLPRTDGDLTCRVLRPKSQIRVCQQYLQGQQRAFQFAMDELHRAAGKFEFLERPFVGSEQTFVSPPPAIEFGRCSRRQLLGIENVGEQPDVIHYLARGLYANEPT